VKSKKRSAAREWLAETDDEFLCADGFDEAIVGYVERACSAPLALYDREKCIEILMKDMSRDEAEEYFEFNTIGAWVGDRTPVFATFRPVETGRTKKSRTAKRRARKAV